MCIRLGIWLTNKFQVTSLQVSLQTMIFTKNKNKKSFHGASVPILNFIFDAVATGNDVFRLGMSEKRLSEMSITVFLFVIFLIIILIKRVNELDNF